MKSIIEIKKIKFSSFMKLCICISFCFGIAVGILLFILSILGGNVYANIGTIRFTGIIAGMINIFLAPLCMSAIAVIFSLLAYLPFKIVNCYIFKSIKLRGDFHLIEENINKNDDDQLKEQL